MKHPMPSLAHLRKAHREFKKIEPRDFFYWSVTKLVSSVVDVDGRPVVIDELVRALMMLLTTWNRNYYRFFNSSHRQPGMTLEKHFTALECVIRKHLTLLMDFRRQALYSTPAIPDREVSDVFEEFANVLGRVGAAKCLHLLAPNFLPLWDAAILKGYGLEKEEYRHSTNAQRYIAFMNITKAQMDNLGVFAEHIGNPLKNLDEYNYCRFTKHVVFR